MDYLITGSEGVVGKSLQDILLESEEINFACIDTMHINRENYMRCDIGNFRQLSQAIKKFNPKIIINLAGEFGRWNGEDYYENMWKTNAVGVKNLIFLQKEYGYKLVHASSSEVYGDYQGIFKEEVMDEEPIKQMNDYAISKWVNELQIYNSISMHKVNSVIFRIFNTYGPGEIFNEYRSAISRFIYCAITKKPYKVFKGHLRTHTYIADCARMIKIIADKGINGNAYNIAGPDCTSMEEVNSLIYEILGEQFNNNYLVNELEPHTTTKKIVSNKKFINLLENDFKFTPLKQGLINTINWQKNILGI